MQLPRPKNLDELAPYLSRFIALVGKDRWFKRADHLDKEQHSSAFRAKIVADYHWLEMAISLQCDILAKEGRLLSEYADMQIRAGLHFAATIVDVHDALNPQGKKMLVGRLRDALKAETGLAALYLEMDVAQRLAIAGCDLEFPDLDGSAQFDIAFSRGSAVGEVECKSLSVDAGRKIHRKDFYRFIEAMTPALMAQAERPRREILLVDLVDRLSPNLAAQKELRQSIRERLLDGAAADLTAPTFTVTRLDFDKLLPLIDVHDHISLNRSCQKIWGQNCHAAGAMTATGGCLIVMRSRKEDDTSKPLLEAMRKAGSQFSGDRPAYIAVQFDDVVPANLLLPHVRRRCGLLSYALYLHYGAAHVTATCFSAFDGLVEHDGNVVSPSFCILNPEPKYPQTAADIPAFLATISDQQFADIIGAPLPADNISSFSFDESGPDSAG